MGKKSTQKKHHKPPDKQAADEYHHDHLRHRVVNGQGQGKDGPESANSAQSRTDMELSACNNHTECGGAKCTEGNTGSRTLHDTPTTYSFHSKQTKRKGGFCSQPDLDGKHDDAPPPRASSSKSPFSTNKLNCQGREVNCYGLEWWLFFSVVICLSFGTRLYKIEWPTHVCWDETHFGKMGSWYINRTFFFDVHPPLGKMLIGLAGSLTGYNGNFSFSKPGNKYEEVPYLGMRIFCASLGASLIPLCYCSVWELTKSTTASLIASCIFIFDTGLLALCQYILLDPPLLFFIMGATFSFLKFMNQSQRPFSPRWWIWLVLTGVFLASAVSVKFVGLFVVALIGVSTVTDLWKILGNLSNTMRCVCAHFLARACCLIILPLLIYMAFFAIHFHRLSKSGSGDGFFSSAFQSQLEGNALFNANMPAEVAYGSVVTIKNYRTGGGYLHSHLHLYPEGFGARQQQVTTYGHKDDNNRWLIKKVNVPVAEGEEPELVMNGDLVRLEHSNTKRNLHSHRIPAPLTPKHLQVTCYGNEGEGDVNDVFKLEMTGVRGLAPLLTVRTTFKLTHVSTGCVLQSHNKQLPKWGWEQMEVTCNPNSRDRKALWNIEQVIDERLPNRSFTVYAPSFLEKFIESHAVMAQGNSGLKPKEGEVTSKPWQWPINYKGQPFSGGEERVYLLGNPVLWWTNLVTMATYVILSGYRGFRKRRGYQCTALNTSGYEERMMAACHWLVLAWLIHYLPFWFMGRVLYFHHYFPSLLYSFMLTGVILDYVITAISSAFGSRLKSSVHLILLSVILSGFAYSFYLFQPLAYGMSGPLAEEKESRMHGLKWLDSWDI